MARNTKALVMAFSMMLLKNLYECGPIDGYKFPVYTTPSCPQNKKEWRERSFVLNCTNRNGYMCIPNDMITELVEFCYTKKVVPIPKGVCLFLNKRPFAVDAYKCHHFPYGCPPNSYFSDVIYKHQSCVSIVEGCFLADPYCERTNSASRNTTTPKYNTEKGIVTNSITTGTLYPLFSIITVAIVFSLIAGYWLHIGIKEINQKCYERSTGRASDPTTELLILDNKQNLPLEGSRVESTLDEKSNQGPLTDRANVQITELLIPDNKQDKQDMPLEGQGAGGEMSSFNRNANPRPLTNCASDSTTELLISNNKQDIPLEGPHAGVEESSLNENSNPRPLPDRACVQATELLIPDNIQDIPVSLGLSQSY